MFETIPQEMKFNALWCCWKKTENGKVPYNVKTGGLAKSNDRDTFYSFKTILNYLPQYLKQDNNGAFLGGIGLGIFNGYSAIDIDNCINSDGIVSDMAQEIIDYCQSYTEKSPSGHGIRIIFKTNFKNFDKKVYYTNNHKIGLEIYINGFTNKFVTITGNTIFQSDPMEVNIEYILNKYMRKKQVSADEIENGKNTYDINKFINKDRKLNELWNAVASGSGGNESETDLALCSKLAFYLQKDYDAINKAFTESPYFSSKDSQHKDKWLVREDYREMTINTAIQGCTAVYNPKQIKFYGLNDTGNAHRFIDENGINLRYNIDNHSWMIWNGEYWQYDIFNNVKNIAEILIEKMKLEAFSINDIEKQKEAFKNINRLFNSNGKELMLKEAQHIQGIPVNNEMFDKDPYLLNCKSGVIDLRNGKVTPHDRNLLLSQYTECSLTKQKPVKFLKFLNDIFEGDKELIHYLHKAFGYSLTGNLDREQKMFILVGDGSNGKSLLLQIINEVIGDYAATTNPELLLDKKTQTANLSEVARLKGKRFVVANELKMGDKLNESAVKDITSGNNKIVARFLYCNEFEFYFTGKIWLATNYEPKIIGTDNGIWRRIIKIPMNRIFSRDEQNTNLINELREEKDAIFTWLVEGCLLWQKETLRKTPKCVDKAIKEYRTEMDIIQRWVNEYCELNPLYMARSTELFSNFKEYCAKNNEFPMSQTLFGRNFGKKFQKRISSGVTVYQGVRLKNHI